MDGDDLYGGDQGNSSVEGGQGNPAWGEFLEVVPQELHPKVTPLLQKWDEGVQHRFEKVHSDYADYKDFKQNGVTRQQLEQGLNILNAISADPEMVWKAMKEAYKFEVEPAGTGQGQKEPEIQDEPWKKQYEDLNTKFETVAKFMLSKQEQEEAAREDHALETELTRLGQTHGKFDEEWVLAKLMVNPKLTPEAAVKAYKTWESQQMQRFGPKPLFMGGNGSLPSTNIDPRKLPDKDVNSLVAEMLQASQRQQD